MGLLVCVWGYIWSSCTTAQAPGGIDAVRCARGCSRVHGRPTIAHAESTRDTSRLRPSLLSSTNADGHAWGSLGVPRALLTRRHDDVGAG